MKFCEECGAQLDDDVKFCEECGTPVSSVEEEENIIHETPVIQEENEPKKELGVKKFDVKKLVTPVIVAVVLLLGVGIGIVISGGNKDTDGPVANNTQNNSESNTDTSVGGNSEVDTEVDTQVDTEVETEVDSEEVEENLGMSDDEYALFVDFVNAVSSYSDWPSEGTDEELLAYQKKEFERWRNGEYESIVIAEDGHAYCELFMGAPYGVYIISGNSNGLEYLFWVEKQNSVYKATYIEQYNDQRGSCTFEITDSYICMGKDNAMKCMIEGESPLIVHANFFTYSPSWAECNFRLTMEYVDAASYDKINMVIPTSNIEYKTFETYEDFYYYMNN